MPFKLVPPPPFYPPLRRVYRAVDHGRQTAIIFLALLAVAGFLGMGFMVAVEVIGIMVMDPRDPSGAGMGFCCVIDPLILGLCLYQTRDRRRSWILPACTFAAILCALALISWSLLSDRLADLRTILMVLALHTGTQILTAGALLALRRVRWIDWLPQEE